MGDHYFVFNGVSSLDMGLVVKKVPGRRIPRKDLETYRVPGRSEPLHVWKQSWEPYPVRYECWFLGDPPEKAIHAIAEWLHGAPVKSRLEDSYDTTVYRWATYEGGADVDMLMRTAGKFTVEFTVGAQGYLKSYETAIVFAQSGGFLNNPSPWATRPLIRAVTDGIRVGGTINIGTSALTILFPGGGKYEIWIDCEEEEAWTVVDGGETSVNLWIDGADFIEIQPGRNDVSFTNSFESVTVWTRAYTL